MKLIITIGEILEFANSLKLLASEEDEINRRKMIKEGSMYMPLPISPKLKYARGKTLRNLQLSIDTYLEQTTEYRQAREELLKELALKDDKGEPILLNDHQYKYAEGVDVSAEVDKLFEKYQVSKVQDIEETIEVFTVPAELLPDSLCYLYDRVKWLFTEEVQDYMAGLEECKKESKSGEEIK